MPKKKSTKKSNTDIIATEDKASDTSGLAHAWSMFVSAWEASGAAHRALTEPAVAKLFGWKLTYNTMVATLEDTEELVVAVAAERDALREQLGQGGPGTLVSYGCLKEHLVDIVRGAKLGDRHRETLRMLDSDLNQWIQGGKLRMLQDSRDQNRRFFLKAEADQFIEGTSERYEPIPF